MSPQDASSRTRGYGPQPVSVQRQYRRVASLGMCHRNLPTPSNDLSNAGLSCAACVGTAQSLLPGDARQTITARCLTSAASLRWVAAQTQTGLVAWRGSGFMLLAVEPGREAASLMSSQGTVCLLTSQAACSIIRVGRIAVCLSKPARLLESEHRVETNILRRNQDRTSRVEPPHLSITWQLTGVCVRAPVIVSSGRLCHSRTFSLDNWNRKLI